MIKKDVIDIIKRESLKRYNINEARYNREDEIVIKEESNIWIVYTTDERASKIIGSEQKFISEEDAWSDFIKRLRSLNRIKK